jgi:hypothetical protein
MPSGSIGSVELTNGRLVRSLRVTLIPSRREWPRAGIPVRTCADAILADPRARAEVTARITEEPPGTDGG